ncbi:hypothetical protein [Nocardioides astragali]|uniref:Fibronectin type-III domain-containing protein n=1 Tax=Nocardioides astragali TaxID=1776736 RepID=A0ABW2MZ14_9ACTN|nr:hypothetical protein [Nocardioides astragali]
MDAHAIPQVSGGFTGVHLQWSGPRAWTYAPGGWTIQRRLAGRRVARDCARFDDDEIAHLRDVRELRVGFGVVTVRDAEWLSDLTAQGSAGSTPGELFRVDLDGVRRVVRIVATAKLCFVTALCEGRVVAVSGPESGLSTHQLTASRIDAVTILVVSVDSLQVCVDVPAANEEADWSAVPSLVTGLQLPFRELVPSLNSDADELALAQSRLLPGEVLDEESFARLAAVLRPVLRAAGPPRPSELVLLLREHETDQADEARGLDPVRVLLAHPTWRRALGFAFADDDPSLVVGGTYEYRISATYPASDVLDANLGFATVPSGTQLPDDFYVGGVRMRVPKPVTVALDPATGESGLVRVTRRGIALDPRRESFWLNAGLDDWSLVVDFPAPVSSVVLELAPGHDLEFVAGAAAALFATTDPVPPGPRPRLDLAAPAEQLRLRGTGFLHALREAGAGVEGEIEEYVVLPPVTLGDTPLSVAPLLATATNLQQPVPVPVGPTLPAQVAPRHSLGFRVEWRPTPAFGLTAWSPGADEAPPLDATIFQVERRLEPAGPWQPVLEDENWTLGDRDGELRELALPPGSELLAAYPEIAGRPTGGMLDLNLVDTFVTDGGAPPPAPGTHHRYRVRAVDAIGRPSPGWREADPVRLEKHVPPPLPVGPDDLGDASPDEPVGVQVRVLVRDAPDLTPAEEALLGGSATAVVLRWGWHAAQRDQDPLASEFRVYAAPPLDAVNGQVSGVSTLSTGFASTYRVDLQLDRSVGADVAAGLRLNAGHPFLIRSHTAGDAIQMTVETRLHTAAGTAPVPVTGPVVVPVPMTADRSRPPAWGERTEVVPLTAASTYQIVLRDRLVVDQDHPVDQLWVGVSAADDQAYVPDQLAPAETRPGNESAIVATLAIARHHGRPSLEIPPPLAAVPVVRTPEPGAEPLRFPLDLTPHLPAAALSASRVRHERVSARLLAAACAATEDGRVLGRPVEPLEPGDDDEEIPVPNPDDRAALVAALRTGRSALVEDRFVVYLAGRHPYRDRLFAPAHLEPVVPGTFGEQLPPAAERWLYRVRAVDRAGHVSAGSATARAVVRVPSRLPGATPVRAPRLDGDAADLVRVAVPADPTVTHVLTFHAASTGVGPVATHEVIRVPNRPDLLPASGCWLAAADGLLLTPAAVPLDGPGVVTDTDGTRRLQVTVPVADDGRTRVWLASLTFDGIPSPVAGPYTIHGADILARVSGGG